METSLTLRLLGGFALEYQRRPLHVTSQRMQSLLAFLALSPPQSHTRQRLAFLLWPDSSESQAFTNLRTLLHRLQTLFPEVNAFLRIEPGSVSWRPDCVIHLDTTTFEAAVAEANRIEASGAPNALAAALSDAVERYGGDLLPDCYDEWMAPERERLRNLFFVTLERLIAALEQDRRYDAAIAHAQRLTQLDPLNEVAHQTLLRLHALNGDRASALHVFHVYSSRLLAEIGTTPGPILRAAYERLLVPDEPPDVRPGSSVSASAIPLVGRAREWRRMQAAWQAVTAGQSRLLVISGEAGIGKTRLAEDLMLWARRQGILTAHTRCYAAEGDLAYAPVIELLRGEALKAAAGQLERPWRETLARLMPELTDGLVPVSTEPAALADEAQRQRLFEALARLVFAPRRPAMLLVDDLQWADRDSLEWLHFLLRYQSQTRIMVIGTTRSDEIDAEHRFLHLLQMLRREGRVTEIPLEALDAAETGEVAQHMLGRPLGAEAADTLFADTEGNPFFIIETLRTALRGSQSTGDTKPVTGRANDALPEGIQAVITWRLGQLSAEARTLLELAAVIGRSFTFPVLAAALELDEDLAVRALDELWQRQIVREQGPVAYDFSHGYLRSVAYGLLSAARKRLLHRRVAGALERVHAAELDSVAGQLAAHYEQAGLSAEAAAFHLRAARRARAVYANTLAIHHYRRGLLLLADAQAADAVELGDELGDLLHFIGRYEEAREVWQRALGCVPAGSAVVRAHIQRKLGNAWRDQYLYDAALAAYADAETTLAELLNGSDDAAWACWTKIQLDRLNVHYWQGQTSALLDLLQRVEPIISQRGSYVEQAHLHQMTSVTLLKKNRYAGAAESVIHSRTALALLAQAGETVSVPAGHFQLGLALFCMDGALDEAVSEFDTALALAERSGDITLEARCLTYLTVVARIQQQLDKTRCLAERSLQVAQTAQMPEYIGVAYANLGWLGWRAARYDEALAHSDTAIRLWEEHAAHYMFQWTGRLPKLALALDRNDVPTAIEQATALLDAGQQRLPPGMETALTSAIAAAEAGDLETCGARLREVCDLARARGYL